MARSHDVYREWNGFDWAGGDADMAAPQAEHGRWNKFQWVGDQGRTASSGWRTAQDMPEGESGLSGFRHNPGVQHWAARGL